MARLPLVVAGLAVCGFLASACGASSDGDPVPGGPGVSGPTFDDPSGTGDPGGASLSFPEQLDPAKFTRDACLALSAATIADENFDQPGKSIHDSNSSSCGWANHKNAETLLVSFFGPNITMAALYGGEGNGKTAYFEKTMVDGYPGVFTDLTDLRARGTCNLYVGVSESRTFSVKITDFTPRSCDRAKRLASTVLANVKREG